MREDLQLWGDLLRGKVDRATVFGNPFSVEQHGHSSSVRMYQLWLKWKLPDGAFPDWAMAMLVTKRHGS